MGQGDSSFLRNNTSIWFHWFTVSLPDFFFLIKIVSLAPKQTGAKRNIYLGHSKLEMYQVPRVMWLQKLNTCHLQKLNSTVITVEEIKRELKNSRRLGNRVKRTLGVLG